MEALAGASSLPLVTLLLPSGDTAINNAQCGIVDLNKFRQRGSVIEQSSRDHLLEITESPGLRCLHCGG